MLVYMYHFYHHTQELIFTHTLSINGSCAFELWVSTAIVDSTEELLLVPVCFLLPIAHRGEKNSEKKSSH
jgi:hypothetical protein